MRNVLEHACGLVAARLLKEWFLALKFLWKGAINGMHHTAHATRTRACTLRGQKQRVWCISGAPSVTEQQARHKLSSIGCSIICAMQQLVRALHDRRIRHGGQDCAMASLNCSKLRVSLPPLSCRNVSAISLSASCNTTHNSDKVSGSNTNHEERIPRSAPSFLASSWRAERTHPSATKYSSTNACYGHTFVRVSAPPVNLSNVARRFLSS